MLLNPSSSRVQASRKSSSSSSLISSRSDSKGSLPSSLPASIARPSWQSRTARTLVLRAFSGTKPPDTAMPQRLKECFTRSGFWAVLFRDLQCVGCSVFFNNFNCNYLANNNICLVIWRQISSTRTFQILAHGLLFGSFSPVIRNNVCTKYWPMGFYSEENC